MSLTAPSMPVEATASCCCREYLDGNEYDSARTCLQKALAKKPADQWLRLESAKLTVSAAQARVLYKKVATAICPDSLRAEAYYRLACLSYVSAQYSKAEQYCKNAWMIDKKALYSRYYAQCALVNGHDSVSSALTRDCVSGKTIEPDKDSAKKNITEEPNPSKQVFYVQAGAFGALENAQALQSELKIFCSKVAIVTGVSNDKNIYRVRVGAFESKEAAQAFGDSALAKRNISFRIVEE
jgi:tetratricopeptide (TPR) repeat protein